MPKSKESFCPTFEACLIVSRQGSQFSPDSKLNLQKCNQQTDIWALLWSLPSLCLSETNCDMPSRQDMDFPRDGWLSTTFPALMLDTKDFSDNSHQNPSCFSQGNGAHSWVFQLVNHAINHFQPTIRAQIHLNSAYNLPLSKHLIIHPKSERQGKATSN